MNILHVNMSLNSVTGGGTVERLMQLHRALGLIDVSSHILTIDDPNDESQKSSGDDITYLPCLSTRWFIPIPLSGQIRKLVKQADVIHLMNHWTLINIWVYLLARSFGKPFVICPAGALIIFGRSKIKKYLYQLVFGNSILKNASAAIAISLDEVKQLEDNGVNPELIRHIPNGVNKSDFDYTDTSLFKESSGIDSNPYILFLGRLNSIKGPDLLIEAFAKVCTGFQHNLVIAGPDDRMEEHLQQLVVKLGLTKRIYFTGHLGGNLKSSAYHGADLMVIPSRYEAMSIVALEAAVTGTPVLLTDQCGFLAMADAGGAVEVTATIEGLLNGLSQLLDEPCDLEKMGLCGQKFAIENYSWSTMAQHLKSLCKEVSA